jgi:hypothetical protein
MLETESSHRRRDDVLQGSTENADILFPDSLSLNHFEQLIQKYKPRGNRVFDLEIVSVAIANGIPEIATANLNDFQGLPEISVVPLTGVIPF